MRAASIRSVSGPASSDTLAAIGGLDVPAHEAHPELASVPEESAREPIPGERDATTLTHREPGAIGGQFSGADTPSPINVPATIHRPPAGGAALRERLRAGR